MAVFEKLNFAIYTSFNFCYRDGSYRKNETPYFNTIILLSMYEFFFLGLIFFVVHLIRFLIYGPLQMIPIPFASGYIWGPVIGTINYFAFVRNKKLNVLYETYAHYNK